MKLVFIHDHPFFKENEVIYSGGGLPSRTWDNYLSYFSKVTVFGRFSKNVKDKKVVSSGNKNVNFILTKNYSSISTLIINYSKIVKELKSQIVEADVVLIRLPSILGFIAGSIARRLNKKIWVEQVGNAKEAMDSHGSLYGKVISSFFDRVNKFIVKRADYVSYVTENKLQNDYPTDGLTVSLSNVIIEKLIENIDNSRFFNQEFKIGLIGGFDVRYKGQDILLKAISQLDDKIKHHISLLFVGKGDYRWLLEIADDLNLTKNIKFIGPKSPGNEILDSLSTLSLYIQPSFTEGMPRALIEAMSVGCPVIGSKVGGIPDVVERNFLHLPRDYKKLSRDILLLYNNRTLLVDMANKSIKLADPYLKSNLDSKRSEFYGAILKDLQNG